MQFISTQDEVNELVEMLIGRQMTPKERKEVKTVTKIQFASIWRPLLKKRVYILCYQSLIDIFLLINS